MRRPRISLRTLLSIVTLLAVGLGGWIVYGNYRIHKLTELRQEGVIVIVRDGTPEVLRSIGISNLSPFRSVPTIELYVTPKANGALLGNSEELKSKSDAQKYLLEKAEVARSYGAEDLLLILIDSFDPVWMKFGSDNSMSIISDSAQRYIARLKANQETGANINP